MATQPPKTLQFKHQTFSSLKEAENAFNSLVRKLEEYFRLLMASSNVVGGDIQWRKNSDDDLEAYFLVSGTWTASGFIITKPN